MATSSVMHNKLYGRVTLHAIANVTWTIAGNNSVSNVAINDEVLDGGSIRRVWWDTASTNNAFWEVKRGSNTVMKLHGAGHLDFVAGGTSMDVDKAGTIVITLNNSTDGFIMLDVQKQGLKPGLY